MSRPLNFACFKMEMPVSETASKEARVEFNSSCQWVRTLSQVPFIGSLVSLFVELPFKLVGSFYSQDKLSPLASYEKDRSAALIALNLIPGVGQIVNMIALNCIGPSLKQRCMKACEMGDYKTFELLVKSSKMSDDQVLNLIKAIQEADFETKQKEIVRGILYSQLINHASDELKSKICDVLHDEMQVLKTQIEKEINKHDQYSSIKAERRTDMVSGCDQNISDCSYNIKLLSARLLDSYCTFNLAVRGLLSIDKLKDVRGFQAEIGKILDQSKSYIPSKIDELVPLEALGDAFMGEPSSYTTYGLWGSYQEQSLPSTPRSLESVVLHD